jgi:selenocysteine lyase/cysteine desulfurase
MSIDWGEVRAQFPALAKWTYLNTATYGQLPRRATERVAQHFAHRDELACWDFVSWFVDMDRVRDLAARLIHCGRDDIAFVQNASTALSLLMSGLDWKAGDRVVTLEGEFPNNIYAPSVLSRRGIEFVAVPWQKFYESIDERTRLVAISSGNYVTGFVPPLEEISMFLRQRGVLFYVDGTQTVGALRLDVQRVDPDMLAVHGYKWLTSPDGAAFTYVAPRLRARLDPVVVGWRSHRDWRNVDNLHHGTPQFAESAEKYEGGMLPFAVLYAMGASLELILEIGPEVIEKRVLDLANEVRRMTRALGGEPVSENSAIVSVRFEGRDPSPLARALKEKRVLVAARHGLLRISTHFYNNEEDLDRLSEALRELL